MAATILDGRAVAREIREELKVRAEALRAEGTKPHLAAVLVGEDPASQVYVRNKQRECDRIGIESTLHRLPPTTSEPELLQLVAQLNQDPAVHGILVQLPLPDAIRSQAILDAVHPLKDVDAFHPENVGRISQGRPRYLPCTPAGIQQLLKRSEIEIAGKHAVIIGRSDIVGKPLAMMLLARESDAGPANATVTVCHSRTRDLASITRTADLLIAAIGRPRFVTSEMVQPGAVVIDVGINRVDDGLVGDVDFEAVREVASALTPVPGGVGPLTIAMLMQNTLLAAELAAEEPGAEEPGAISR